MSFLIGLLILIITNVHYVGTCVKRYFIYVFLIFLSILPRVFVIIVIIIYNYCIICDNVPYIGRCKLVSAIIVFYN